MSLSCSGTHIHDVTGLFYVIEGFLDILLPTDDLQPFTEQRPSSEEPRSSGPKAKRPEQKLLFTVKPGGIAGYLGESFYTVNNTIIFSIHLASLCNTASYVDIKAKTDTYVGFLPSHALERLLEKRPIVLLTLAKRLISLLSPLGTPHPLNSYCAMTYCFPQCFTLTRLWIGCK